MSGSSIPSGLIALPIDPSLADIVASLETQNRLILQAAPGSGKTTRVPPALLQGRFAQSGGGVLVLEPRRLAAKWAALRVSDELGQAVGQTVGYRFRFEKVIGSRTRITFVTEGMFSRMLLENPRLEGVSAVVLDEFHERHLYSDFALAYLRRLQESSRSDLRLIVMSATLDTAALKDFLSCPVIQVDGRQYPVEVEHLGAAPSKSLDWTVKEEVSRILGAESAQPGGDLLVFLPGKAEIRRSADALSAIMRDSRGRKVLILPLHGDLSREEQDRAMRKGSERRVILSTNIAETSLTIEGVDTVIDSGLHRIASNSWWSGMPALRTRPISRASATQRAGRAGRTGPGRCIRLYTRGDHDSRAPFEVPEILRLDLSQSILELISLGIGDLEKFPWFEAPPDGALTAACELLYLLGAVTSPTPQGELTPVGKRLARIPAHPRLGRILLEASAQGLLREGADLASLISEGDLEGLDGIRAVAQARMTDRQRKVRDQFLSAASSAGFSGGDAASRTNLDKNLERKLARAALVGFPDRVARKRVLAGNTTRGQTSQVELVFSRGGSALVDNSGIVSSLGGDEYFVIIDAQENQAAQQLRSRTVIRSLCPIESDWLFDLQPGLLQEQDKYEWDNQKERAMLVSRITYDQLVLLETRKPAGSGPGALKALLGDGLGFDLTRISGAGLRDWLSALERIVPSEELEINLTKLSLLARYVPDLSRRGLRDPLVTTDLHRYFEPLLQDKASFSELKSIDWSTELALAFGYPSELLHRIEEWVPGFIVLPSGRRARIHYRVGQAPWIESRLQDFFGWEQGPALFHGELPLVLHLLAPNQRPVQVTTDLRSFWQRVYPELRGQLSRRYPRHAWPEDPMGRVSSSVTGKDSGR